MALQQRFRNKVVVVTGGSVTFLGTCGHGTTGLKVSRAHMGRIKPGVHRIETPVGLVEARLHDDGSVSVHNAHAYHYRMQVQLDVPAVGRVHGDIA